MMLAPPALSMHFPFTARRVRARPVGGQPFVQRGHVRVVAGTPVPEHVDELPGVALEVVVLPERDLATLSGYRDSAAVHFRDADPAGMLYRSAGSSMDRASDYGCLLLGQKRRKRAG